MVTALTRQSNPSGPLTTTPAFPWGSGADPATRYVAHLNSETTRRSQASALRVVAQILGASSPAVIPWHRLTLSEADALAVKVRAHAKGSVGYANRILAAIRGTLDVCRKERWLTVPADANGYPISQREHFEELTKCLNNTKAKGQKYGRELTNAEIGALNVSCQKDGVLGVRDAAMLALGIGCGLRREEIAMLLNRHINTNGRVDIMNGKGNRDRVTQLPPGPLTAVRRWMKLRGGAPGDRLFVRISKGAITSSPVGAHAVWEALMKRRDAAGVEEFKPHDLRRTHITRQLRAGTAISSVSLAVGHENVNTTQRYDRARVDEALAAIGSVDVPEEPGWED